MLTIDCRRMGSALLVLGVTAAGACSGRIGGEGGSPPPTGGTGSTDGTGNRPGGSGTGGMSMVDPGPTTGSATPFDMHTALTVVRKTKGLLTGMAPTDAEVAAVTQRGAAALQDLITDWMKGSVTQPLFRDKMVGLFRNVFQQIGFTPTEDFKLQLLENGGFDLNTRSVGDDVYFRLVQNLQDSFALTAWELINDGRPFSEVLTTRRLRMTTALKALYLQIENPNDGPFGGGGGTRCAADSECTLPQRCVMPARGGTQKTCRLSWSMDYSGNPIPLEETMDPASPNFLVFDDQCPMAGTCGMGNGTGMRDSCRGMGLPDAAGALQMRVAASAGYSQLFQRLIGYVPEEPTNGTLSCQAHAGKPYFTVADTQDWTWVTINKAAVASKPDIQIYDLPKLRAATELNLVLPRVGYYTTPAFLALWNTNDSNQHRVTANQTLLVALGQSFSSESMIAPLSTPGLDAAHSVAGTECYGCHKSLDPMKQFWGTQFDFNDRNDFPAGGRFNGATANARPAATGGVFAFGNMNMTGADMFSFGDLLAQVSDNAGTPTVNRFAMAMAQQLCFYANSDACAEADPEFRRVAATFESSSFNYAVLVKELFSSPLVTGVATTATYAKDNVPVSVARRDHLCTSLSNRLGRPDLCASAVPLPSNTQAATLRIAGSVPADAFSRGAESPVTPNDPNLFFRAAGEALCENLAAQLVDATTNTVYASADVDGSIRGMVETIMAIPPTAPEHDPAIQILREHYDMTAAGTTGAGGRGGGTGGGGSATRLTNALRSTFVLACESPTAVSFGL